MTDPTAGPVADAQRSWVRRKREQQQCFHHDLGGNPANSQSATSWIKQELIDLGRRKRYWCTYCEKMWLS